MENMNVNENFKLRMKVKYFNDRKNAGPLEILLRKAARKNILQRCKDAFATNDEQYSVNCCNPSAQQWCLVGALSSLTDDSSLFEQAVDFLYSIRPKKNMTNLGAIHDSLNANDLCKWWKNGVNKAQGLAL